MPLPSDLLIVIGTKLPNNELKNFMHMSTYVARKNDLLYTLKLENEYPNALSFKENSISIDKFYHLLHEVFIPINWYHTINGDAYENKNFPIVDKRDRDDFAEKNIAEGVDRNLNSIVYNTIRSHRFDIYLYIEALYAHNVEAFEKALITSLVQRLDASSKVRKGREYDSSDNVGTVGDGIYNDFGGEASVDDALKLLHHLDKWYPNIWPKLHAVLKEAYHFKFPNSGILIANTHNIEIFQFIYDRVSLTSYDLEYLIRYSLQYGKIYILHIVEKKHLSTIKQIISDSIDPDDPSVPFPDETINPHIFSTLKYMHALVPIKHVEYLNHFEDEYYPSVMSGNNFTKEDWNITYNEKEMQIIKEDIIKALKWLKSLFPKEVKFYALCEAQSHDFVVGQKIIDYKTGDVDFVIKIGSATNMDTGKKHKMYFLSHNNIPYQYNKNYIDYAKYKELSQ